MPCVDSPELARAFLGETKRTDYWRDCCGREYQRVLRGSRPAFQRPNVGSRSHRPRYHLSGESRGRGLLRSPPCCRVALAADEALEPTLVSFGTAGVFYSLVIETINKHRLVVDTRRTSWPAAQETLRTRLLDPATSSDWFFEITTNPTGQAWVTTMNQTTDRDPDHERRPKAPSALHEITSFVIGLPFRLALRTPLYIARVLLRTLNPFEAARIIGETLALIRDISRLARELSPLTGGPDIAAALPGILNLLWRISHELGAGSDIVDEIQNLIAGRELPVGRFVAPSHLALTREGPCPDTLPHSLSHIHRPLASTAPSRRDHRRHDGPLAVGQIAGIRRPLRFAARRCSGVHMGRSCANQAPNNETHLIH